MLAYTSPALPPRSLRMRRLSLRESGSGSIPNNQTLEVHDASGDAANPGDTPQSNVLIPAVTVSCILLLLILGVVGFILYRRRRRQRQVRTTSSSSRSPPSASAPRLAPSSSHMTKTVTQIQTTNKSTVEDDLELGSRPTTSASTSASSSWETQTLSSAPTPTLPLHQPPRLNHPPQPPSIASWNSADMAALLDGVKQQKKQDSERAASANRKNGRGGQKQEEEKEKEEAEDDGRSIMTSLTLGEGEAEEVYVYEAQAVELKAVTPPRVVDSAGPSPGGTPGPATTALTERVVTPREEEWPLKGRGNGRALC
ncbi:hypothetical protein F4810DRAFT_682327 [Camillea tinctor]|nr:hypothetical protein F4810DRAFT_682327 [Camillea tinctor]